MISYDGGRGGFLDDGSDGAKFRILVESMPQIAYVCGADGVIEYVNARWAEYTGEVKAGPDEVARVVHPDDQIPMRQAWEKAIGAGAPLSHYFRLRRASDHEYRWHLSRALPLKSNVGEVVRWYGTSTDVDDIKQAEEALRSIDERRDAFLATLAHELRNPQAPLQSGMDVLRLAGDSREAVERTRGVMERQVRQLTRLIDDLMEVSRMAHGRSKMQMSTLDIENVVNLAIETVRPVFEAGGNSISLQLPKVPLLVRGDSARLVQLFGNVLHNSSKFTRAGRIVVEIRRDDDRAVVSIADDGEGIAPEVLPGIFEPFGQIRGSRERTRAGLGIGLYLVHKLVEAHAGSVQAESEGEGKGTTVIIELPLASVDHSKNTSEKSSGEESLSPHGRDQ